MFNLFRGKNAEAPAAGKSGEGPSHGSTARDQVKYALEKKPLGVGEHFAYTGSTAGLPVLIVPGFMSSGLVIEKSEAKPEWEGKRAWLDLKSLDLKHADAEAEGAQQEAADEEKAAKGDSVGTGAAAAQKPKGFGAMIHAETTKATKAVQAATCRKIQEIQDGGIDRLLSAELVDGPDHDGGLGYEESESFETTPGYKKKQGEWIKHLLPGDEGSKDPKGIEVRTVSTNEGLDGVTSLTDKDGSSSFAKVVKLLEMVGYERGVNLRAMPYDWRLPPKCLEERDAYFSRFKETVEQMVKAAGKPVVLLSHSLGGKVVHYFLSWVTNVYKAPKGKFDAKAWIDEHIHTFIPLGGPFLGVPKRARCVISGDDLGLGSTLAFDEALRVGRGLGSQHFLTPHAKLLEGTTLPSFFFMRSASRVLVRLKCIEGDLSKTVVNEGGFFLSLKLDKKRLRTRKLTSNDTDTLSLEDESEPNLFQFSSEINDMQGTLSVGLFGGALDEPKDLWNNALFQESVMKLSEFDLQPGEPMSITAPLTMKDAFSAEQVHPVMLIMEVTYEPPHVMDTLVDSKLSQALWDSGFANTKEDSKKTKKKVAVVPPGPGLGSEPRGTAEEGGPCPDLKQPAVSLEARGGFMAMEKRAGVEYAHRNPEEMMMLDDMSEVYGAWQKNYRGDPAYGVNGLAAAAPAVPRVFAIYGVNCPTEVGAAYRYRNFYRKLDKVNTGLVLDTEASLKQSSGYTIQKGIIKETSATKQKVADSGEVVAISGDGTVPYASLRHCMSWESAGIDVKCSEIQKCTHRGVLFSPEVHQLLLDYVCTKPALYILIKSMTVNCEDDVKAQFMDHKGEQVFVEITFKGKTFRTELLGGSSTIKFTKRQFGFGITQAELVAEEKPRCTATLCKANIMTKAVEGIGINKAMKAMGFKDPNAGGRTKLGVASLNTWHSDRIRPATTSIKHEFLSSSDGSPLGISITLEVEAKFNVKQ